MNILGGLVKTTTRSLYTNASRISMFILVKTYFCIHTEDICIFQTICVIRNWYVYTNTITRFPLPNTALPGRKALRWIVSPKTLCVSVGRVSLPRRPARLTAHPKQKNQPGQQPSLSRKRHWCGSTQASLVKGRWPSASEVGGIRSTRYEFAVGLGEFVHPAAESPAPQLLLAIEELPPLTRGPECRKSIDFRLSLRGSRATWQ